MSPIRDGRDRDERRRERSRSRTRDPSIASEDPNPGNNLFVTGLSPRTELRDLEEMFGKFGKIEKAEIMYDPHTRESRRFGFVRFENTDDAARAIEGCNGSELNGKTISVEKARRGRARTPTPGRYYGAPKRRPPEPRRYIDRFDPRYDHPRYAEPRGDREYRGSRYDPRSDRSYDPRYDGRSYDNRSDRDRYDRYDRYSERDRRPPAGRYDPYPRPRSPY